MSRTPIQDLIVGYEGVGYEELDLSKNNPFGGSGARVIVNRSLGRAIKFNHDPAYDKFIEWAQRNQALNVPKVFRIQKHSPSSWGVAPYTEVEMELLEPLNSVEVQRVEEWIGIYLRDSSLDESLGLYHLNDTMKSISEVARSSGYGLDLKPSNFMVRDNGKVRVVIFTDPLGNGQHGR